MYQHDRANSNYAEPFYVCNSTNICHLFSTFGDVLIISYLQAAY